jgi:hypothetical protein
MSPKTLSECIVPITKPVFKMHGLAGTRIITEWRSIVGGNLADHCIPQKLSFPAGKKTGGTLSISVENGYATELQHMQPVILERLATYFGYKAVTRITISHTYAPEAKTPAASITFESLPPDCIKLTETVEDKELQAALASIAKTLCGK